MTIPFLRGRPSSKQKIKLPLLIWIVAVSTVVACAGDFRFLGFNIAGYAWVVPLVLSVLVFLRKHGRVTLPFKLWVPWICVVLGYLIFAEAPNALQRSVMLLCPIFIGATVSKFKVGEGELEDFRKLYRYMAISLYVVVVLKTGMLVTGELPQITGLAAEAMTGTLLCTLFATSYALGERKALRWWAALAAIPVIALTRMGMVAAGASLPATFAPLKTMKRLTIIVIITVIAIPVFYSERSQKKMFYSGQGSFSEARFENPDFRTSGRKTIWDAMSDEIRKEPWFGHGANASESFVSLLTGGLTHPHNDWLRLLYDYGYFGTAIFGLCMALQVLHILKRARRAQGQIKTVLYAGASSFVVFVLFMFTDNIILYAAFFGNLQFTLLGLAYGAYDAAPGEERQGKAIRRPLYKRISW